jgi:hypothetical protein
MLALVASGQLQILLWRSLRFLDEPMEQNHPALLVDVEEDARNAILVQVRPYQTPSSSNLQTGIPIGHPNSTLLMSSPIRFRSSVESRLSHSRTGSPPAPVR